jgi:DNA-binding transcriptional ArsR family regulator
MSPRNPNTAAKREQFAPVFAALGDETRLELIARLSSGQPRSIAQLTEGTQLTRQAITKHLRVLENADIVRGVRVGRESLFELNPSPIRAVQSYAQMVSEQWDQTLARLKAAVEKDA